MTEKKKKKFHVLEVIKFCFIVNVLEN